jgi:hypothetical protein
MSEATMNKDGNFACGVFEWMPDLDVVNINLINDDGSQGYYWIRFYLDDLYAVLHARHIAQHYDSELMARIEKAVEAVKDDGLYKGGD